MPDLTCYACEREPIQQCPRCGRPYCEDHGEDFCDVCLEPSSGLPSFTLYRGSLLALLVGAALAVWLILQPPGKSSESALRPVFVTATSPAGAAPLTTATSSPAAAVTGTPAPAGPTATRTSATPAATFGTGEYVVVSGDTLSGICSDKIRRPSSMSVSDCVSQVRTLNGLSSDNLEIGQKLRVPQ